MKQIDAMLWVAAHDLVTSYVAQIVPQNLLGEQIDQCLDVHCHLLLVVRFFKGAEVDVRKRRLEELDVEGVTINLN